VTYERVKYTCLAFSVSILLSMAQYVIRESLYAEARIRLHFSPSGYMVTSLALKHVCCRLRRFSPVRIFLSILRIHLNVVLLLPDEESI